MQLDSKFSNQKSFLKSLTPEQIHFFHSNGYLVLRNVLSVSEVSLLKKRVFSLSKDLYNENITKEKAFHTSHSNGESQKHLIQSSTSIEALFEKGAFDENGDLLPMFKDPNQFYRSINKIAHNLHEKDSLCKSFISSGPFGSMLRDLK